MNARSIVIIVAGVMTALSIDVSVFRAIWIIRESALSERDRRRLAWHLGLCAGMSLLGLYAVMLFALESPGWLTSTSVLWFLLPLGPAAYLSKQARRK